MLALLFGGVVLGVRARGEIAAEAHRDGAGDHLGEAGGDDYVRVGDRRGKTGRQRERHGQAVGHPDHDVADAFGGGEVLFDVRGGWHRDAPGWTAFADSKRAAYSAALLRPEIMDATRFSRCSKLAISTPITCATTRPTVRLARNSWTCSISLEPQ